MKVHISPFDFETGLIDEDRRIRNVIDAVIVRDATDETTLLESATVTVDSSNFTAGWYAVDALEAGTRTRIGVFLFTLKKAEQATSGQMKYELAGVSTLYNASISNVKGGYSVTAGNSGTAVINELLGVCVAPLEVTPFQVAKTQTFNGNVTKLGACWSVLRAANMCMQIQENGTIKVMEKPTNAVKTIAVNSGELLGEVSVSDSEISYNASLKGRPYDLVTVNLPTFGMTGTSLIASQDIDLSDGLVADETLKEKPYDDNE